MSINLELLENLIIEEIAGHISDEDLKTLQEAVAEYPEARRLRDELHRRLIGPLNTFKAEHPAELAAEHILNIVRKQRRKKAQIRQVAIAAAACFLVVFGSNYLINVARNNAGNKAIVSNQNTSQSIILSLPGGQAITLDSSSKNLQSGNVSISTSGKTLKYAVTDKNVTKFALLTIPNGKDYKILLSDGSEIHVNSATQLRFPLHFSEEKRELFVNGEAYIKVKTNANQPFIVHMPHGDVEVLGTEFNINTYDSAINKVALVTGKVLVKMSSDSVLLKPGKEAIVEGSTVDVRAYEAKEVLAWREGRYFLNEANFYEISKLLSRWYGQIVVVDNEQVAKQRFSGVVIKSKPIEFILDGMKLTNTINYYTDKNGVIHIN